MTDKVLAFAVGVVLAGLASTAAAEDTPVFRGPAMRGLVGKRSVLRGSDAGGYAQER
jgi:hypothetical protein